MRLAVLATAIALAGCTSGGTFVVHKDLADMRQAVLAEMNIVMPHIKPEHLNQCEDMLERPSILGAKYEVPVNLKLVPSIAHSCVVQGRDPIVTYESDRKAVVLTVPMMKVAGMYGTGSPSKTGVCTFSMLKGNPEITVSLGPEKAPMTSPCHRF